MERGTVARAVDEVAYELVVGSGTVANGALTDEGSDQ